MRMSFILIGFFLISIALPVRFASAESFVLDRIVAVINKEAITWGELYRSMELEYGKRLSNMDDSARLEFFKSREAIHLENLINVRLQMQEAKKLGINVKDSEAEAAIESIRLKNNLSPIQFSVELKQAGHTDESYKKLIIEQITIARLVEREVRRKVNVTPADVKEYLDRNHLGEGKFYLIRQAYFKPPKIGAVEELKTKISLFMAEYNKGVDFSELVMRYSENASTENGGDLGYLHETKLSEEFNKAIATMKPGEISRPFQSQLGIHIIRLDDIRTPQQMLEEERFDAVYREWLRDLREGSLVENRL